MSAIGLSFVSKAYLCAKNKDAVGVMISDRRAHETTPERRMVRKQN